MGIFDARELQRLRSDVRRLDRLVEFLLQEQGISLERIEEAARPKVSEGVRQLAGQGKTLEAIRLLRKETGATLIEAKETVDRL